MSFGSNFHIGDLRFQVTLATRVSTPDGLGGFSETFQNPIQAWASITPIGLQTFLGGMEVGIPITHRIIMRWQDGLDEFDVVLCQISRPDGTTRQTLYRIRRIAEWEGRQRFTVIEAEQEKQVSADA